MPLTEHLTPAQIVHWTDGESSPPEALCIEQHLAACPLCHARYTSLLRAGDAVSAALVSQAMLPAPLTGPELDRKLRRRIAHASSLPPARLLSSPMFLNTAAAIAIGAAAALILTSLRPAAKPSGQTLASFRSEPDRRLTPGAVRPVLLADVCQQDDDDLDPALPPLVQRAVLREYGIAEGQPGEYQVDYLVSPQLGGTAAIENLWPQPNRAAIWNARTKDALERRLQQLVCSGQVDLPTAQQAISSDWIAAYRKYVTAR